MAKVRGKDMLRVTIALMALALAGCPHPQRALPPPPDNEAACLSPERYADVYAMMSPRIFVRVMSDHETAFLSDDIRRNYIIVQLRQVHRAAAFEERIDYTLEIDGRRLEPVPPTIEDLAGVTGEPADTEAREAARSLIVWATGGLALFSDRVPVVPSHVQLYALLGTDTCRWKGAQKKGFVCEITQAMFRRPTDESADAAILLSHDFVVEQPDGLRERACPPDNLARIALPPGKTLSERIEAKFPPRRRDWRQPPAPAPSDEASP